MKKVENNPMIIWLLFAIGIFIFFVSYLIFSIYPNLLDIESKKSELKNKISYYNTLKSKWFDFNEFKSLNSKGVSTLSSVKLKELLNDDFYKKIYKEFDKDFYDESIYDTWYSLFEAKENFWDYLVSKNKDLKNIISGKEFSSKVLKISKVLPKYSTFVEFNNDKWLTDLAFINYIENLLNKFGLKTKDSIWIKDIIPVDNDIVTSDDNIYYIPLELELEWLKLSLLDFLRYIKNTWDIEFSWNDFDFSDKVGSTSQISEIEKIEFKEYIDSSYDSREKFDNSLERFLAKTNQTNDSIIVKVNLRFYVSGLSSDKIKDRINFIIWNNNKKVIFDEDWNPKKDEKTGEIQYVLVHYNYNNLLNIVKNFRSNSTVNKNDYYKRKVDNIFKYLNNKDIKRDFNSIRKELNKTKDINNSYRNALKYKEIFLEFDKELYEISKYLWIDSDKFDKETWELTQKSIYPKNYIFENK